MLSQARLKMTGLPLILDWWHWVCLIPTTTQNEISSIQCRKDFVEYGRGIAAGCGPLFGGERKEP